MPDHEEGEAKMLKPRFPFLPEGRERVGLLPWVIAVMMYLTGLTAVGGVSLYGALGAWSGQLQQRVTVQIITPDDGLREEQTQAALDTLSQIRGVSSARRLSDDEVNLLLEPWLGGGNLVDDLPVPTLIDVELDEAAPATLATLRDRLHQDAPGATLDDHQQWLAQVKRLVSVLVFTLIFILALVLMATVAIVVFGTRSRLAMYDGTVEIMHLIGADDGQISKEFEWRFLNQGLRGGAMGAFAALVTLFALSLSSGFGEMALLPTLTLDLQNLLLLLLIPLISAVMTMVTARLTVMRALKRMV